MLALIGPRTRAAALAAAAALAIALHGCFGAKVQLPPVTTTVSLLDGFTYGPEIGLAPGTPLKGYVITSGLECNLPDEQLIIDEVRKAAGEFVAGLVSLKRVKLDKITVTARTGDFKTIERVHMGVVAGGLGGVKGKYFGQAWSPAGFDKALTVAPSHTVDLLPLMRLDKPACGTAIVAITGTAPAANVVFDVEATVTVEAEAGFF